MTAHRRATIGVIGGMGPAATVDFLDKLVRATPARKDQDHLRVLVDIDPSIPDRTAAIEGRGPTPGPRLAEIAVDLQDRGADILVMPCNTAHAFVEDIRRAVTVPLIDMIACAVDAVPDNLSGPIGVLATSGTIRAGIYQDAIKRRGLTFVGPTPRDQATLMGVIAEIKESGRSARAATGAAAIASRVVESGAQAIILACTELPLIADDFALGVPIVDATLVLAEEAVRASTQREWVSAAIV